MRECRYEHYLVHPVHTTIITIISSPLVPSYIYIYIQQCCVRVQPQHNEMILSSFPCLYLLSRSPILSITHLFLYFSPPSSYQKRIYALIITYVFIYCTDYYYNILSRQITCEWLLYGSNMHSYFLFEWLWLCQHIYTIGYIQLYRLYIYK